MTIIWTSDEAPQHSCNQRQYGPQGGALALMRLLVKPARQATALCIVTLALAWPAAANERVAAMLNEDLRYDIAFLWFSHVAVGRIRLQPGAVAGTYIASLDARTLGLTAFLTRHRRSRYESTMELSNGRFRPLRPFA